jgi:hypothetical protein
MDEILRQHPTYNITSSSFCQKPGYNAYTDLLKAVVSNVHHTRWERQAKLILCSTLP